MRVALSKAILLPPVASKARPASRASSADRTPAFPAISKVPLAVIAALSRVIPLPSAAPKARPLSRTSRRDASAPDREPAATRWTSEFETARPATAIRPSDERMSAETRGSFDGPDASIRPEARTRRGRPATIGVSSRFSKVTEPDRLSFEPWSERWRVYLPATSARPPSAAARRSAGNRGPRRAAAAARLSNRAPASASRKRPWPILPCAEPSRARRPGMSSFKRDTLSCWPDLSKRPARIRETLSTESSVPANENRGAPSVKRESTLKGETRPRLPDEVRPVANRSSPSLPLTLRSPRPIE